MTSSPAQDVLAILKRLLRVERDVLAAHQLAAQRLAGKAARAIVREFCTDHVRHLTAFHDAITALGGDGSVALHPATEMMPACRGRTGGPRTPAARALSDRAVLAGLLSYETEAELALAQAFMPQSLPLEMAELIAAALADVRRQRLWTQMSLELPLRIDEGAEQTSRAGGGHWRL